MGRSKDKDTQGERKNQRGQALTRDIIAGEPCKEQAIGVGP